MSTKSEPQGGSKLLIDLGELIAHRHHHFATRDFKVQRLVESFTTVFVQHVFTRDTQIRCAILHISRYI